MTQARSQNPWLFGPGSDLLLGCGLLYLPLAALFLWNGPAIEKAQPEWVASLLLLVLSTSHYGATLLRVYEEPSERRAYRLFAVYTTLLVFAAFAVSVWFVAFASVLVTVMLTWSPWHYTGQNYGIAVMFLRRRGVEITPVTKRLLYASFILSYALVFLVAHVENGAALGDSLGYQAQTITFVSLAIPRSVDAVLFPLLTAVQVGCTLAAGILLLRRASIRALLPTAALLLTQAAWFTVPRLAYYWKLAPEAALFDVASASYASYYFVWIALGHAVQYLWITSYYARSEKRWDGYGGYFLKAFVAGNAVWVLPVVLFSPGALGSLDYSMGLALCVSAAVNLHHFILDGAVWKLRNSRIASVLILRDAPKPGRAAAKLPGSGLPRRLAWAVAATGAAIGVVGFIEMDFSLPRSIAGRQLDRASALLDHAAWYGRDSATARIVLANNLMLAEQPFEATRHFRRSLDLYPQAEGYATLGDIFQRIGGRQEALRAWEQGLELFPDAPDLLSRVGWARLDAGEAARALPYLERAAAKKPDDLAIKRSLVRARRALGG